MRRRLAAALAAAIGALPGVALAQTTGGISGQVVDSGTQSPVARATVVVASPSLQGEQSATTDATGAFELPLLPAGAYTLAVRSGGYQPLEQGGLAVRLGRTIRVRVQLVPDTIAATEVDIVGTRPALAVTTAQTSHILTREQAALLPTGRLVRGFEELGLLVPGVRRDTYGLQIAGATSPESRIIVDGLAVNDPAFGIQSTSLLQDFIDEVEVQTGGFRAESGRSTGGIVTAVTRSGGNEFHGSVFGNWSPWEGRRNAVPSAYAIATQESLRGAGDFGAELGGPILRDRLWFFAGFAPQIVSRNNDRIIQALIDDGSGHAAVGRRGLPEVVEVARQNYLSTTVSWQYVGKLTLRLAEDHDLALAVYGNPSTVRGPLFRSGSPVNNGNEGAFLIDQSAGAFDTVLRYQGKFAGKHLLLEANVGLHDQSGAGTTHNQLNRSVQGVSSADLRDRPGILWRSTTNLLNPAFDDGTLPSSQRSPAVTRACAVRADGFDPCPVLDYQTGGPGRLESSHLRRWLEEVKFSAFFEGLGHHQAKLGVSLEEDEYEVEKFYTGGQLFHALSGVLPGGAILYSGAGGFALASPLHPGQPLLDPSSSSPFAFLGADLRGRSSDISSAFFLQDTWSIFDRVILDAGVRVELQQISAGEGNPSLSFAQAMPRVGLVYDWTGRGLGRAYASAARFYERVPLDVAERDLSIETLANYSTDGSACSDPKDPRTCRQVGGFGLFGSAVRVDPNARGQYVDEVQAGLESQIADEVTVSAGFIHRQIGRVLEDLSYDGGATFILGNPGERGTLGAGGFAPDGSFIREPTPERRYDAFTVALNKQFSNGSLLGASYTASALRGNYPGLFTADYRDQLDPNATSEYDVPALLANRSGPLPGDVPNAFRAYGAWVRPLGARTELTVGATLDLHQGGPTNYLAAGSPAYGSSAVFLLPRGSGPRLPWTSQLDLRFGLQRRLEGGSMLGLTLDVFNATNAQRATAVDQNYTLQSVYPLVNGSKASLPYARTTSGAAVAVNANFGQPLRYQEPLAIRFGARWSF